MGVNQSAMIFPYTGLDPILARTLAETFSPVYLGRAAGMTPDPQLADLVQPWTMGPDDADAVAAIKAAAAECRGWIASARDPKDLVHLRSLLTERTEPATPSALVSAIRTYGRAGSDRPLGDQVIMHLAADSDRTRAELRDSLNSLRQKEENLGLAMGLKAEDIDLAPEDHQAFNRAVDPLDLPDADPFLGLRLRAWAKAARTNPPEADCWITSVRAAERLRDDYELKTDQAPERVDDPGPGLIAWRFDEPTLPRLLGLDRGGAPLLVAVSDWPD